MEYYAAIKKDELLICTLTRMDLTEIMFNIYKYHNCMIPII